MNTTFLYALCDPITGKTEYVGKSNAPEQRYRAHMRLSSNTKTHVANWIRKLGMQKLRPKLKVLTEVLRADWQLWERELIKAFRLLGISLKNTAEGGIGGAGHTGFKHSPAALEKMSKSHIGKIFPPEQRAKISAAISGEKNYWFGKVGPWKGRKHGPEAKEKDFLAHFGKKHKTNTSGFVGVSLNKDHGKWQAFITVRKRRIHLGRFWKIEDAVLVRRLAEDKYFA